MIKKTTTSLLLVYSSSKRLSTGPISARLGLLARVKKGFLLIEIMIALAAVGIFSSVVAYIQGQTWSMHHDTRRYLEATTLAANYFECANHELNSLKGINTNSLFTVTTKRKKPDEAIPFEILTVTISWKNMRGMNQEISIIGGIVTHVPKA